MVEPEDIPEADAAPGAPHPRHSVTLHGQGAAEAEFLRAAHAGRMHHGWLITGPKGVGKATFAWRAARFLLQGDLSKSDMDLPPDDPLFRRIAALAEPGLFLCRRQWDWDKKRLKKNISVDDIRALKTFFSLSATDGGWRTGIIDAADDMTVAAANALLKILEEPPQKTALFLICHQPGRLLPTLRSRTVALPLAPLAQDAFAAAMPPDATDATALFELSGGAVGAALELHDGGGIALYKAIVAALSTLPRMDRQQIGALADKCAQRNAEATYALVRTLIASFLARAAKAAATNSIPAEGAPGEAAILARLAPHPRAAVIWADLAQDIAARHAHAVTVNLDPALVILDTFLKIEAAAATLNI